MNFRLAFHVICVQMQTGLVFCLGPKKMTNVSNNKHNAFVWSNPEEDRDQISPGSHQKLHAKKSCSINYQGVNNQGHSKGHTHPNP
jgi:hypothetical protein